MAISLQNDYKHRSCLLCIYLEQQHFEIYDATDECICANYNPGVSWMQPQLSGIPYRSTNLPETKKSTKVNTFMG